MTEGTGRLFTGEFGKCLRCRFVRLCRALTFSCSGRCSLPNHKFRFAGVGVNDTIYTFGGQSAFEEGCQCYPTTKDVVAYVEVYGASGASSAGLVWMSAVSSILVGALSMV
jgi:hypothetical protein